MTWIYLFIGLCVIYLLFTIYLTYLVHQIPRKPVKDSPDWGKIIDTRITTAGGGTLEVWRVEPEGKSRGTVVLAHGWSRNRDRMVGKARIFGSLGFTTVMHSARDHGNSSPKRLMNAPRFAEDIEAVLEWLGEPVLLYGHSAGAAASVIVTHRNPGKITHLFIEGCYDETKKALLSLYRQYHALFGYLFAPMVIQWMDLFYRTFFQRGLNSVSPAKLASSINVPVLIIHAEKDKSFPIEYAMGLKASFPAGSTEMFVAKGSDHSSSSLDPDFPKAIQGFLERHYPAE